MAHTALLGANIITKAREIVENIGRPLELDTDGIWCCLPGSFPENYEIKTNHPDPRKQKVTISYPGAMLNVMVFKHFTNDQYHDLEDPKTLTYSIKSENSIFFEVDGPYLAMILPAAKEEGKKLKKRYAVFNFDGSLAELKGFELKRRGELQLIKNFQSSVFSAFLEGKNLEEVYAAVAKVADYWLDILFSKAENMPDDELFELISSQRSMSKKLEEYGAQKSTSISTAKRIAEFLGDQMTKDKGLNCKFIIARKPEGTPVTERAIPVAIFQAEPAVRRYYLRRWLKTPGATDFDIRDILDWDYYKERFGSAIMKIITIPAALQGVTNPVPRVQHPDWLYKMVAEKNDVFQQKKITDMFGKAVKKPLGTNTKSNIPDIESVGTTPKPTSGNKPPSISVSKQTKRQRSEEKIPHHWKDELGEPPIFKEGLAQFKSWLSFHKEKWKLQKKIRQHNSSNKVSARGALEPSRTSAHGTMDSFLRQGQKNMLRSVWEVIQVVPLDTPGLFRLWVSIDGSIQQLKVTVPRIFYVNSRTPKEQELGELWRKTSKILPRSVPVLNLYEYTVPEDIFQQHAGEISTELAGPDVEGVYETNVPALFRVLVELGCACSVSPEHARFRSLTNDTSDTYELGNLQFKSEAEISYMCNVQYLYIYEISSSGRNLVGVFSAAEHKATVFVTDSAKTNSVGNLGNHYKSIYGQKEGISDTYLPPEDMRFEVRVETSVKTTARAIQRYLTDYKDRHKSVVLIMQSVDQSNMQVPAINTYPVIKVPFDSSDSIAMLDWQRHSARKMLSNYFSCLKWLEHHLMYARYVHVPIGNVPEDLSMLAADVFYARHLLKQNHVLWASNAPAPDLGGKEEDDHRLTSSEQDHVLSLNFPAAYNTVCVEINLEGLAVNTILHSHHVNDLEGVSTVSLDTVNKQVGISTAESGGTITAYDEAAQVSSAFKVLKSMVISWLHQVSTGNNQYADSQLIHFYRWLTSSTSLLYDPALARVVNSSIKKLFLQLIMEVKKLGSSIVYCDMNRIIVATKKRTIEDAHNYTNYIINSITSQELFGCLGLQITKSWENLLWLDSVNYGGALRKSGDLAPTIQMNWNLKKFLPEDGSLQKFFQLIIAGYIQAVNKTITQSLDEHIPGETPIRRASQKTDTLDKSAIQEFVADKLVTQLYGIVQRVHGNMPSNMLGDRDVFPKLPGSHLELKNPSLEFIKCVCKVLSLDSTISAQVHKLKKDLLRLVSVGEFSEASIFKDPCLSFVLPEVICNKCSNCRDLDLCRDPYLDQGPPPQWLCAHCQRPYDRDMIEERLVAYLQQKLVSYTLQDLVCNKCNGVKNTNMADYCTCAGGFVTLLHMSDLQQFLLVLDNISRHFDLPLLAGLVQWSKEQIPSS